MLSCCLSNAILLSVERRTIVCRTPNDCLSNAERLFVERRTIIKKLYVITDRGNTITQMPEGKKTELEATYGPVEKGYHIGLSCNDEDEKTHSNFHVRISVKKNDNPFVLIKEDYGSDVTLMYVIN